MNEPGMTLIVRRTARLVTGFIAVFGIYIAVTGHISPGGGFAGGVILAAAAILIVLAFGRDFTRGILTERQCHVMDVAGAGAFLFVAMLGYFGGSFFFNFINAIGDGSPADQAGKLLSGGTIPLSNLAILVKVGAGLAGAFLALAAYRRVAAPEAED